MPREVFRDTGINHVIELTDSESEQEDPSIQKRPTQRPTLSTNVDQSPFVSNSTPGKPLLTQTRRFVEIIELSSSSDEDTPPARPIKQANLATPSGKNKQQSTPTQIQNNIPTITSSTNSSTITRGPAHFSSSEEEIGRTVYPTTPVRPNLQQNIRDIVFGEDGIIQYNPTPRRHPAPLTPSRSNSKTNAASSSSITRPSERRRTLLPPDPVPDVEDLSWEVEEDGEGGIRTGAMLTRPTNALDDQPAGHLKGAITPPASPSKTPRRKKMPESIAELHRIAIPYLKELDRRVFGNRLRAAHLPELAPPSPTKNKRGKDDGGVIWGMGSRGEYNDQHDSYIELVWSNRMATTAGRTEYKKTPQGKITIKIELGVKVITSEERLRNTLAHEACHAASWAINGDFKSPHGATFKSWARKVEAAFPGVQVTTKHDYQIDYKFSWKCLEPSCSHVFQRHSNSINLELQGCFCGSRLEPQFKLPVKKTSSKAPTGSPLNSTTSAKTNAQIFPSHNSNYDDLANALTSMTISNRADDVEVTGSR